MMTPMLLRVPGPGYEQARKLCLSFDLFGGFSSYPNLPEPEIQIREWIVWTVF
jgi:hypothetical protein